jgi:hypothetical protein
MFGQTVGWNQQALNLNLARKSRLNDDAPTNAGQMSSP